MNVDEVRESFVNMGVITGLEDEQFKTAIDSFISAMGMFGIAFENVEKAIRGAFTISILSENDKTWKYNKKMRNRQKLYETRRRKGFRR